MTTADGHQEEETSPDRYRRQPVEDEISRLPVGVDADFRRALSEASQPETLVHGIRRLKIVGDDEGVEVMMTQLIDRTGRLVASCASKQSGKYPQDYEDIVQEVSLQIVQNVLDTSEKTWFWEANFLSATIRACSNAARTLRRQRQHERYEPLPGRLEDDGETFENTIPDSLSPNPADLAVDELTVVEAIRHLDGDARRAVFLRLHGFKVGSKDPDEVTIASILEVTPRTVRNYLSQARQALTEQTSR